MDNYKIRVNSIEESERAQKAFFALGYKWPNYVGKAICHTSQQFLLADSDMELDYVKTEKGFNIAWGKIDCTEITLEELEKMAEKTGMQQPQYEIAAITESPNEGQKRYAKAVEVLRKASSDYGIPFLSFHQKALKIAAGLQE